MQRNNKQINAEKAPYLTDKLKVWMLPTLALIKAEKVVDYVVGFDDLGGKDDFSTEQLAERLARADVINRDQQGPLRVVNGGGGGGAAGSSGGGGIRSGLYQRGDDDEDSDFE
jgi:hypothetical protein